MQHKHFWTQNRTKWKVYDSACLSPNLTNTIGLVYKSDIMNKCTFSTGLNQGTNLLFIWIQGSKIWNTAQSANLFSKVQQNKLYELLYIYKVQCRSENLKHSNDAHDTFSTSDFSLCYFVNSLSTFMPLHVVIYSAICYSFSCFSYFCSCMWSYTAEVYCVQMSLKKQDQHLKFRLMK